MTDKPGRLAALARLITGPPGRARGSFQVRSPSAPPPSVPHPHTWAGMAKRGPRLAGKAEGPSSRAGSHAPFTHSFIHSPIRHSFIHLPNRRSRRLWLPFG